MQLESDETVAAWRGVNNRASVVRAHTLHHCDCSVCTVTILVCALLAYTNNAVL